MRTQPLYRRPLNDKQLSILHQLYKFRFATTELLTKTLDTKDKSKMNKRLKILLDQEYVGRNYEPSYRLRGQHASFYLLPKGIQTLKSLTSPKYAPSVLHNIRKDKTASDRFISHWLSVFSVSCQLSVQYGDRLRLFTTSELAQYDYFPRPLPDLYLRLKDGDQERQFLVDVIGNSQPLFAHIKRLKQYVAYAEEGDWEDATGTELPTVILVCESKSLQSRLLKLISRGVDDFDEDDLALEVTVQEQLMDALDAKKKARDS